MTWLLRIGVILVGYLAASAMAGLGVSTLWATMENGDGLGGTVYRIFARAITFTGFAAVSGIPLLFAIAFAEYAHMRRYVFYALCGVLIGLLPVLWDAPSASQVFSPEGLALNGAFAAVGLLSATVYWLIAGRSAGLLRVPD